MFAQSAVFTKANGAARSEQISLNANGFNRILANNIYSKDLLPIDRKTGEILIERDKKTGRVKEGGRVRKTSQYKKQEEKYNKRVEKGDRKQPTAAAAAGQEQGGQAEEDVDWQGDEAWGGEETWGGEEAWGGEDGELQHESEQAAAGGAVEDSRPPCRFFLKGKCRDGDNCRFSHATSSKTAGLQAAAAGGAKMCTFFLKGKCRAGENCRFSHGQEEAAAAEAEEEEELEQEEAGMEEEEEEEEMEEQEEQEQEEEEAGEQEQDEQEQEEVEEPMKGQDDDDEAAAEEADIQEQEPLAATFSKRKAAEFSFSSATKRPAVHGTGQGDAPIRGRTRSTSGTSPLARDNVAAVDRGQGQGQERAPQGQAREEGVEGEQVEQAGNPEIGQRLRRGIRAVTATVKMAKIMSGGGMKMPTTAFGASTAFGG
eukprot:SAG22_NODE_144_length_17700_cov_21.959207_17_plen_426_part_01